MKTKFTSISEKHPMPKHIRAKASQLLAIIIEYGVKHYNNTKKMRDSLLKACNVIMFCLIENEPVPHDWLTTDPLSNIPEVDEDLMKSTLEDIYLSDKNVEWDLTPVIDDESVAPLMQSTPSSRIFEEKRPKLNRSSQVSSSVISSTIDQVEKTRKTKSKSSIMIPTDKTDLYLQGPKVPQFDNKSIWMQGQVGYDKLVIYESLPKIPTRQSEISVTTDVSKMTNAELMNLYPNCFIRTRNEKMYEPIDNLGFDSDLGVLLPICSFTDAQILDNIIKYPHFYKLVRSIDGQLVSFYSHIEINGELKKTLDVWDTLPESKLIPRQPEFIKEYVVRRYLLERDILGMKHNYPMFGTLNPYLTLFMPPEDYIKRGYTNTHDIVIQCVNSRVSFKQSRNPVIRRLSAANE